MIHLVDVFGTKSHFRSSRYFQSTGVILKCSAVYFRFGWERWEPISLYFHYQLHNGDCIAQKMKQSDVFQLRRGQHDLSLQFSTSDDGAGGIQDGVAGLRLGGAWIVSDGRAMPVATKVGVGVHLETLVIFRVQRDSLSHCGLEILNQVDYRISV